MAKKPDDSVPTDREQLAELSNLTHGQLAIWTAQQQDPTPGRFSRVLLFDLEGRLDTAAFQRGFRALVDGNDALRTVVTVEDGVPQRQLMPAIERSLSLLDFSAEQEPDATLDAWVTERCAGSAFEDGQPLFQSALIRLREQHYAWYLNQHQLITDAPSTALVCKRMADLYARALRGEPDVAVRYPAYADYVAYERRHRESGVYVHSRSYWQRKLAEPPAVLEFFGYAAHQGGGGSRRLVCRLGADRSARLAELARIPGHFIQTLGLSQYLGFVTLLFAFVYRATGSSQLRIGAPFTSRTSNQFDDTVGLFSEVCPLQIEINGKDSLQTLLKRLLKEVKTVLMHAQPGVSCTVADHPCQVLFDYVNIGCIRFRGLGSRLRWLNSGCGGAGANLRMQALDFADCDGVVLQFELDADSFDTEQSRMVPEGFLAMVDTFLDNREQALDDIPMPQPDIVSMPAAESRQGLAELMQEPVVDA